MCDNAIDSVKATPEPAAQPKHERKGQEGQAGEEGGVAKKPIRADSVSI
jgi:hypothetical protein